MSIFQSAILVIVALIVSILLRQYGKKEISIMVQIATGTIIMISVILKITDVVTELTDLASGIGLNISYIKLLIKVLGICIITQFVCEICKDSGESALASQIEFAGKIIVVTLMLPLLKSIISLVVGIIL